MRNYFLLLISFCIGASLMGQERATLERAIAYYQQLKFEESLNVFDELIEANPNDISLQGRRGFVCCRYIMAVDNKLISSINPDRYAEVIKVGIADLKVALEKFPGNSENRTSLQYLQGRM